MKKILILLIYSFLISCSTTGNHPMNEADIDDKDYIEIPLKIPKRTGIKERYIVKAGDKVFSSFRYSDGFIYDPETKQLANGILKQYYDNGVLRQEGILVNGRFKGKVYGYHDNGNLARFEQFNTGNIAPDGLFVFFSKSGDVGEILFKGYNPDGMINRTIFRLKDDKIIYENY